MVPNHLKDLAMGVPELLQNCKANSTVRKYCYGFLRWRKWAKQNGFEEENIFPVKPFHLCIYLTFLVKNNGNVGSLTDAMYGVKWAHDIVGRVSPTVSLLVKNVFEGAKRLLAKPVQKKQVITVSILDKLYDKIYDKENLYNQRIITMCLFAYAGFMRSAEVLALRRSDVQIRTSHMEIFVEQSKTDIYRDGAWIIVSRTGSRLCPVCNFELYLKLAGISVDSEEFVFRNLTKMASGRYSLRNVDKPMTYSRFREIFIEAFTTIVQDISQFGLHSLRAGGASAAANSGIPDRMFKRHGRWKSETAKDGYIKDDFRERLNVSMHLNL
ncbi:integrase/recombinase xerD homolog [Argopecten irradians]|uniref:integrase/recombinase xerD homolog n=1 Tax=Argopecten irradians TaxID=31199 RepID=UPI0037101972